MRKQTGKLTCKSTHKWLGVVFTVFLLLFCVSGILLNHRDLIRDCNVSRSWLPSDYHLENYNNGIIKGTIRLTPSCLLCYGNAGVWCANNNFTSFTDFNHGLPAGIDQRNIRNIAIGNGIWCASQNEIYRYENDQWNPHKLPGNSEKISDITFSSNGVLIALTRSNVYRLTESGDFEKIKLPVPDGYKKQTTLFKTIWHLHSGEFFGLTGKIIVDCIALIIIFLSISGLVLFMLPIQIKKAVRKRVHTLVRYFKWNFKWHNRIGYWTIIFTLFIAFTGMCLRPPLMVPLVLAKIKPLAHSSLDSDNPWHDKLRALRWDNARSEWILSSSEGFYAVEKDFKYSPKKISQLTPPVSPMGVNVFQEAEPDKWLIGSFSGMFLWDRKSGAITDYFTGKPYVKKEAGRPISDHLVCGYSKELDVVFDHYSGANGFSKMPLILKEQPMSLWNVALEVHVGRIYSWFLGPLADIFIFLSGAVLLLTLISGLIIHNRLKPNKSHK